MQRVAESAATELSSALTKYMLIYNTAPRLAAVSDGHRLICCWVSCGVAAALELAEVLIDDVLIIFYADKSTIR